MRMPWHRQRHDPIEAMLRENRPQPRPEFTQVLLARLALRRRQGLRARPVTARAFGAVAVTIFALVGATIAAGGPVDASHGLVGFANVGKHFKGVKDDEEHNWGDPGWPGNWENSIPICHKQEGGWVLLHLVPKTAFVDFFGSKHDFIAGPNWPCPPFR